MKRQICRNYASKGFCEYGKHCRFLHITETPLLDPPTWIFCHHKEMHEFSPEEVRAFYYDSRMANKQEEFANEHDKIWMSNYKILCDELDTLQKGGEVVSDSDRCVDVRERPEIFNKMFYPERLLIERQSVKEAEPMIIEEKKGHNRAYGMEVSGGRREESYTKRHENGRAFGRMYDEPFQHKKNDEYKGKGRYDDYEGKGRHNRFDSDKPRFNTNDYRSYEKGIQYSGFDRSQKERGEGKDYRSYSEKGKYNYTPPNKFEDRNNVYEKGFKDQGKQPENVVYDKFGNIVERSRGKKNLDSLFDDDKPNTYFKK